MALLPKSIVNLSYKVCIRGGDSRTTVDNLDFRQSCLCLIHFHTVRFILSPSFFFAHIQCSYVSVMAIIVSNYGYFSTTYTQQACQRYYLVAPIFKGLSYRYFPPVPGLCWPRCSHTNYDITGHFGDQVPPVDFCGLQLHRLKTHCRTFNIARRDRRIGVVLALLYLLSTSVCSYYTVTISLLLFVLGGVVRRSISWDP